ncbi:MAG TPA: hypothetical protein P5218_16605, partial [Planctomycetota bacterium]|nr:hypothetical protein [Planctomycetota bacterium]
PKPAPAPKQAAPAPTEEAAKPEPTRTLTPPKASAAKTPAATTKSSAKPKAKARTSKATLPPDDLKAISGIGPAYAQLLADVGIATFKKLAQVDTPRKLELLAAKIEVPVDRIQREKWVEKAKRQHAKKYGVKL